MGLFSRIGEALTGPRITVDPDLKKQLRERGMFTRLAELEKDEPGFQRIDPALQKQLIERADEDRVARARLQELRIPEIKEPTGIFNAQVGAEALEKTIGKFDKGFEGKGKTFEEMTTTEKVGATAQEFGGLVLRGFNDVGLGVLGTAEGTLGAAEWLGIDAAKPMADKVEEWRKDATPEDQNLIDGVLQGVGSMATFFIPGMGVQKGATTLAMFSPKIAKLFGIGTMTFLEASTEAGQVYRDNMAQGMGREEASNKATADFALNIVLLGITNKLSGFFDVKPGALKSLKTVLKGVGQGSVFEGLQEMGQQYFSNLTTGRPPGEGVMESGLIGAITGGFIGGGMQADFDVDLQLEIRQSLKNLITDKRGTHKIPGIKEGPQDFDTVDEFIDSQGETVYHRSPNKFNKFDISKVSNDSNKQRYGWGLYFSDTIPHNQYGDNLYEARLSKGTLIDIQKPVDEKIVSKIVEAVKENNKNPSELTEFSYNGFLFYKTLSRILGGDKKASLFLSNNGIVGLKNNIGKNANDYILFNHDSIKTKQELIEIYNKAKETDAPFVDNRAFNRENAKRIKNEALTGNNEDGRASNEKMLDKLKSRELIPEDATGETEVTVFKAGKEITTGSFVTVDPEVAQKFKREGKGEVVTDVMKLDDLVDAQGLPGSFIVAPVNELQAPTERTDIQQLQLPEEPEELEKEINNKVEQFRKEADLMASKEGAGVRTRDVTDAVGNLQFQAKDFSLPRAKKRMKLRAEQSKEFASELLYDNDPEYKAMVDKLDEVRATQIDQANSINQIEDIFAEINKDIVKLKKYDKSEIKKASDTLREAQRKAGIPGKRGLKKVGLAPIEREVTVKEAKLLKDKFKNQQKGGQLTKKQIEVYQKELTDMLKGLPKAIKGDFLNKVRMANTQTKLDTQIEAAMKAIQAYEEARALAKVLGKKRGKLAFIRKIGEFNQVAINDAKKQLGIKGPTNKMTEEELNKLTSELLKRIQFKRTRGFKPKIKEAKEEKPEMTSEMYSANRDLSGGKKDSFVKEVKSSKGDATKGLDKVLGAISTRLKNIHPALKAVLRDFEFFTRKHILSDNKNIEGWVKAVKDMDKADFADYDYALKNGDVKKINEINKKYKLEASYQRVKDVLDGLYERGINVGFDIGYLENYFPRIIKDSKDFLKFVRKSENWSQIQEAVRRREAQLGRDLNTDEKALIANTLIRGFSGGRITLSEAGNMKERKIDFIDPEMNQFYVDAHTALIRYIRLMNEKIEARRLFGKQKTGELEQDDPLNNMKDSIGAYTTRLIEEGTITSEQEEVVRDILQARLDPKGPSQLVGAFKNLGYIDVLGTPLATITQLGDLAISMYKGGMWQTIQALPKGFKGTGRITLADLGLRDISAEFAELTKLAGVLDKTFRLIGFHKLDNALGDTLIEATLSRFEKESKMKKIPDTLIKELKATFGTQYRGVLRDLQNGHISDNVKLLLFNTVLNFQPRALSEMPQKYLTGGNARVFYMLKTWSLKIIDVYRNEVFQEIATGNKKEGLKNLMRLTMTLVLMGASADAIKDFLKGKEVNFSDNVIENIVKLAMFSRWDVNQVKRDGLGRALSSKILPPFKSLDNFSMDLYKMFSDTDESFKINEARSVKNIPFGGELFYWWFGKGSKDAGSTSKAVDTRTTTSRSSGTSDVRQRSRGRTPGSSDARQRSRR